MRQVKFRGKKISSDESKRDWVFGYYLCTDKGSHRINDGTVETEVYPDTVSQFTGFCDSDGNEIFEGDIVTYNGNSKKFVITWDDYWSRYQIVEKVPEPNMGCEKYNYTKTACHIMTVVGNIYEEKEFDSNASDNSKI